jgi:Bacterial extracellular solute-binding protein.
MLFPAIMGCADKTQASSGSISEISETAETTEVEETLPTPDLPSLQLDGKTFTVLASDWCAYDPLNIDDITRDELTGDALNDAIYARYKYVDEIYNCDIKYINIPYANMLNELKKSVMADDGAYDTAIARSSVYTSIISAGVLLNLDNVPYINYDDPWYYKQSLSALSVLNKNYGIVSDLTMNQYLLVFCAYVNLQMMADYSLGNIYDIVREGSWSLDKLGEMSTAVAADVNGDGLYTNEDRYGMTWIIDVPEGLINAAGICYGKLDSDGIPQITYNTESAVKTMQAIYDFLDDTQLYYNVHKRSKNAQVDEVGMFASGEVLCSIAGVYYAPQFRGMEQNFGIIPLPKLSGDQENYYSPLFSNIIPIMVVPKTNGDLESTGAILTELAYLGKRDLYPALYDNLLQGKITRDENSNDMLDMIFENTFYDPGIIFYTGVRDSVRNIYMNFSGNFTSVLAAGDKQTQKTIDKLIESMQQSVS